MPVITVALAVLSISFFSLDQPSKYEKLSGRLTSMSRNDLEAYGENVEVLIGSLYQMTGLLLVLSISLCLFVVFGNKSRKGGGAPLPRATTGASGPPSSLGETSEG